MNVFDIRVAKSSAEFVAFWSKRYSYRLECLYDTGITRPLNDERIRTLYQWKNGTETIAPRKEGAVKRYQRELKTRPMLRTMADAKSYLYRLSGGPIWDIFWLHCLEPNRFPIFDQHTFRAMAAITQGRRAEIPKRREEVLSAYLEHYLPFFEQFTVLNPREVDRALFTYGRFLKSPFSL